MERTISGCWDKKLKLSERISTTSSGGTLPLTEAGFFFDKHIRAESMTYRFQLHHQADWPDVIFAFHDGE